MGRLFWLFTGLVMGAGAIYCAFNYHVLKTSKGFELIPKRSASLSEAYVDVSKFAVADWTAHPALSADVMAAEKSHLLNQNPAKSLENGVNQILNEIRQ